MNKFFPISAVALIGLAALALAGCGSGVQTETRSATAPDKSPSSFNNAVKSNPNIPDAARNAMINKPNPVH
jgi:hypothetical protein